MDTTKSIKVDIMKLKISNISLKLELIDFSKLNNKEMDNLFSKINEIYNLVDNNLKIII